MDDLADELDVMHLADSFFPTGLFATSNGIESMFLDGKVRTIRELTDLTCLFIERQVGPCDCVMLACAYESAKSLDYEKILRIDSVCAASKTIRETREASIRSGAQLARCVGEFQDGKVLRWYLDGIEAGRLSGVYPVSFAICCHALGIRKEKAMLMFLYGFVVSNIGAALRLGMIQHLEGHAAIHQLKPLIRRTVRENSGKTIGQIWQFCPQIEINQMSHEDLDSKMFLT